MYYEISGVTVVTVEVVTFITTPRILVCGHEHFVGICYPQLNDRGGKFLQNTGTHLWVSAAWLLKNRSSDCHAVSYLPHINITQECISIVQVPSPAFWSMLPSGVLVPIFWIWQCIRKIGVIFFLESCMCTECGIEYRYPDSKRHLLIRRKEYQFCFFFIQLISLTQSLFITVSSCLASLCILRSSSTLQIHDIRTGT